tara:strand:+ start:138 stop:260 length:123 start_codon:yes stop_codon:yes gene_type:complete
VNKRERARLCERKREGQVVGIKERERGPRCENKREIAGVV